MPVAYYGGKTGQPVNLQVDPDLVAVRTISRRSLRGGPVGRAEQEVLEGMEMVERFPEAGVEVYRRTEAAARSTEEVKRALRSAPDTRFAGSVLVDPQTNEPVLYTENIYVKFKDEEDAEDCRKVLERAGLRIKEQVSYATNAFFAAAPEGTGQKVFDIANELLQRDDVEAAHPELVQKAHQKQIFPQQWHLRSTTIGGVPVQASANVEAAHQLTQGEGAVIAIIDDGVDLAHPEFSSPGKVAAKFDFESQDSDPSPGDGENHGTACAGVACADGRFGASGVAPKAKLIAIRMPRALGSQRMANAFAWAADNGADVISCSWGPADGRWWVPTDPRHNAVAPLPDNVRAGMDYAATRGRGGKGCLIFFAAGNGNESVDNDGYASHQNVIAVAACNDRGKRSVYSDFGRAVFCSFPSDDSAFPPENRPAPLTPGIWTTDRVGRPGYRDGDYTDDFGGTSSACPGAAGVAALVIARNPELTAREVKEVLKRSCVRIDPQAGAFDASGHSKLYGFGRLDAEAAARLATEGRSAERVVVRRTFAEAIPDLQTARVNLEVTEAVMIADLKVEVDLEHTFIGDLVVALIPPGALAAPPVVLHDRKGGRTRNLKRTYSAQDAPGLAALNGMSAKGRWQLQVRDAAREDSGVIKAFGLDIAFETAVRAAVAGRA